MTPAICLLKSQLRRSRIAAKLFLIIGASLIASAFIGQTKAFGFAGFAFHSAISWAWPMLIGLIAVLLALVERVALKELRWLLPTADEVLVWQDQFAKGEEEAPLVLLAASDVFMRSALHFHLTRAGFRVEHATSCDEAVSKMKARPAAVFLDLGMPNSNRFYCLRDVLKASPSTKILAFSRKHGPQDTVICRKLGAFDSISKPFDPTDAVSKITHALNGNTVRALPVASFRLI